jgi:cardiolipin synthase A/B
VTVRVAIPMKLARLRAWVDKGRYWSAIDRLILWALLERPQTSQQLSTKANLPRRLINEIILRLMRVGWVELAATPSGVAFRGTAAGEEAV